MFGNHLAQRAKFVEQNYLSRSLDERRRCQSNLHNALPVVILSPQKCLCVQS
jgi:hypothetical protein